MWIACKTLITGSAMWGMFIYGITISGAFCQDLVSEYYALTKTNRYEKCGLSRSNKIGQSNSHKYQWNSSFVLKKRGNAEQIIYI